MLEDFIGSGCCLISWCAKCGHALYCYLIFYWQKIRVESLSFGNLCGNLFCWTLICFQSWIILARYAYLKEPYSLFYGSESEIYICLREVLLHLILFCIGMKIIEGSLSQGISETTSTSHCRVSSVSLLLVHSLDSTCEITLGMVLWWKWLRIPGVYYMNLEN